MKSNFEFVEKLDKELFAKLLEVEKRVKIDPFGIGNHLRHVLEYLCSQKISKYNLRDEILSMCEPQKPSLYEQLRILRDKREFIPRMQQKPGNETLKAMPTFRVKLEYKDKYGKTVSRFASPQKMTERDYNVYVWVDSFLRQIGNDYSHEENLFTDVIFNKTYENVIYALRCLQDYIRMYYDIPRDKVPYFNEDWMPISDYEITSVCVPTDKERTSCQKEYTAKRYEDLKAESVGCSIIRQYPRTDSRAVFLRRAPDVYLAGDSYGSLLKKVTILSQGGHEERPFYIVAYDFRTEAKVLNGKFLSGLTMEEREHMCLSYAKTMACFHNNPSPIYHRVFSAKCAYYADERNTTRGISTAIIKFEYAKIADGRTETVIGNRPQNMFSDRDDARYIAPEWNSLVDPTANDWSKVDIYSLGILFMDILMGSIGGYTPAEFAKKPENAKYLPLIQKMCSASSGRPDINEVCSMLERKE